jgi:hypothetical protein
MREYLDTNLEIDVDAANGWEGEGSVSHWRIMLRDERLRSSSSSKDFMSRGKVHICHIWAPPLASFSDFSQITVLQFHNYTVFKRMIKCNKNLLAMNL